MSNHYGTLCIILFTIISSIDAAAERDWSFQEMCEFWNGNATYRARDGSGAMIGDRCTFNFPHATGSEESARQYCEDQVPFHIITANPGEQMTSCEAEATVICKSNYIQLFGRCYKMTKQLMTFEQAVGHCGKENTTIAFMHREALPFRINDYYTLVSRLWIDASEAITDNLIHNEPDGHLLLALDGYPYDLPNIALARVAPDEKAMVLCEYTPPMTQSESNYLLGKYGQIYYPTVATSEGSFVRTASSLNRNEKDNMADNKYCSRVMRPFIPGGNAQSAIPTVEFMEKVLEVNSNHKDLIIRTSAFSKNFNVAEREKAKCAGKTAAGFHIFLGGNLPVSIDQSQFRKGEPIEQCDAASWSSAIVLSRDTPPRLEAMSDARYAPIYCQSLADTYKYDDCPAGWTTFYRQKIGQKWCHKFIETKMSFDDAEANCVTMGAHVTGFDTLEEYNVLVGLYGDRYSTGVHGTEEVYIGAKRRAECTALGSVTDVGYDRDTASPCARARVFEWINGVAPNPPELEELWDHPREPNHVASNEICLEMVRLSKTAKVLLNDIQCGHELYSICGKEAPIVKV